MARRRSSAVVCAVTVWCAALAAQQRAPCTGVLRGDNGAPLAGAEVTFAFAPSIVTPGEADRVTTITDEQGRFGADLESGLVYTVWAIGPADTNGERRVCRPAANAAAGWPLELVASERRGPARVQVAGTAPWIAEGPLALRVFVAGSVALGRDVPVPGDGPLALPPLPSDVIALALLDGRGSIVDSVTVDLAATRVMEIAPPLEVDVVVHDVDGKALAGARVVQDVWVAGPQGDLLIHEGRSCDRLLATTDARGEARVRAVGAREDSRPLLRAEAEGHATAVSGWIHGKRTTLPGRMTPADDDPIEFELPPAETVHARVAGLADGAHAIGWYRQTLGFRLANGGGVSVCVAPAHALGDGRFATAPAGRGGTYLRLGMTNSVDGRTLACCYGPNAELPPIELDALCAWKLSVVDASGQPVAGVQVGIANSGPGHPVSWLDRFALPLNGRITLRLPRESLALYATTATAHGVALGKDAPPGELHVILQPMAVATLRVVDAAGAPVAGARLECAGGGYRSPSMDPEGAELDCISFDRAPCLIALARSDATGAMRLELPIRDGGVHTVRVRVGGRVSKDFRLQTGSAVQEVVVR